MGHVAVEHPFSGIVGHKFEVARLRNSDQHSVRRSPERLRLPPCLRPGDDKGVAVQVNRMVVHAEIDKAKPHATAKPNDERRSHWAARAVERQPVPFHVRRVWNGVVRQNRPFLQHDPKIVIHDRCVGLRGMQDEHSDQTHHLLHRRVRMIEESAVLMDREFVGEPGTGRDGFLGEVRHAVHRIGNFQAVPVNRERLGQLVLNYNPEAVAVVRLNCWARRHAVEAPAIDRFPRCNFSADWFGDKFEYLDLTIHFMRKNWQIGCLDWHRRTAAA
jgi:hypothetical protein